MKSPYEILGMKENENKDEIKRRYAILLKRYKAYKMDPENVTIDFDLDEVNTAYNNIMGYDIKAEDPNAGRNRPILRMMNIEPAKFDNFWHYNRIKILVWVIVTALVVSMVVSMINNKPYDLNISLTGKLYLNEDTRTLMVETINSGSDLIENSIINTQLTLLSDDPSYEMAMIQKFMAEIAAKELDIIICDEAKFNEYVKIGLFLSLEEIFPQSLLDENKDYYRDIKIKDSERIIGYFGIDVSNIEFFKDIQVMEEGKKIFCILINSERLDAVNDFIKSYILN